MQTCSWTPGAGATSHDVYFGTSADDGSGVAIHADPGQEKLYVAGLNMLAQYCGGVVCQYAFTGECWGLKRYPGQPASEAPKWRGALQWINSHY